MKSNWLQGIALTACALAIQGCSGDANVIVGSMESEKSSSLTGELRNTIDDVAGDGIQSLMLPASEDYSAIPQDPQNPITAEKVLLGRFLFHDTALATTGQSNDSLSWSCASCHHAAAGFKSGVAQGIGEGGTGFGADGSERRLSSGFDAMAQADAANKPDLQPFTSPSILNSAFQDVMLWNGQFGNAGNSVNKGIPDEQLLTPGTPKAENVRQLSGLEIQAIAGLGVHRLNVSENSVLQTNETYQQLFNSAYPSGSIDVLEDAGKAIAAYERTVLATEAPFQKWLAGDSEAMSAAQIRGGVLFFGKAGCADCHRGPGLSSEVGASEDEMFMAIGFNDFSPGQQMHVHGPITDADKQGRGGLTSEPADMHRFKIPQLYNLRDTNVFGHGASFSSIREVLEYKNAAIAQNEASLPYLDQRFIPLQLTVTELNDLEDFLANALYDDKLMRYQPGYVPSGECLIVDPKTVETHGLCP